MRRQINWQRKAQKSVKDKRPSPSNHTENKIRPHGKESTEVQITQNKGKESEKELLPKIKEITVDRHKQNRNISTDMAVFLNQKRVNVFALF